MMGLSASVYTTFYVACFRPHAITFLLFIAGVPVVLSLLAFPIFNGVPFRQQSELPAPGAFCNNSKALKGHARMSGQFKSVQTQERALLNTLPILYIVASASIQSHPWAQQGIHHNEQHTQLDILQQALASRWHTRASWPWDC